MKLHYVALRKDMFLYMDVLYTQILKWKGFLCFSMGGRDVVTARWNKWGVRDRGRAPLGSPITSKWFWQLTSRSLCQIYCTKQSGAGCF